MPAARDVGEPCAGEPHARFDGGGRKPGQSVRPRGPGASRLPDTTSKIARDTLKLLTLREHRPGARLIIALADPAVVKSLTATSWLAEALRTFSVEVLYVEIPSDARDNVAAAEIRQVMVNPPSATD